MTFMLVLERIKCLLLYLAIGIYTYLECRVTFGNNMVESC